jgi:hypothetical protein
LPVGTANLSFFMLTPFHRQIRTYQGLGTTKRGVRPEDHCLIYTKDKGKRGISEEIKKEPGLLQRPIRVEPLTAATCNKLNPQSRLNLVKLYTVEHTVKVRFTGKIHGESLNYFFKVTKQALEDSKSQGSDEDEDENEKRIVPRPVGDAMMGIGTGTIGFAVGVVSMMLYATSIFR